MTIPLEDNASAAMATHACQRPEHPRVAKERQLDRLVSAARRDHRRTNTLLVGSEATNSRGETGPYDRRCSVLADLYQDLKEYAGDGGASI